MRWGAVNPGEYGHRLVFQEEKNAADEDARDTTGVHIEDWQPVFTVWGAFKPGPGDELLIANKRQVKSAGTFRMPYDLNACEVTADRHRIVFGGKTWNIHSVNAIPDGRPIELEILASEIK